MKDDPTPGAVLKRARIGKGFKSAGEAARFHRWPIQTYRSHENKTRGISRFAARKYAKAYGINPAVLIGCSDTDEATSQITFCAAQLGAWQDKALENKSSLQRHTVIVLPRGRKNHEFQAVHILDNSVSKLVDSGGFAFVENAGSIQELGPASYYLVERTRGELVERTIRKAEPGAGKQTILKTYSHQAKLNDQITFPSSNTGEMVRILGRVVAVQNWL